MPYRVLVTGSTGFVGSQVATAALSEPECLLRLVHHHSAPRFAPHARVETVRADLTVPAEVRGLCRGIDAVVHCASRVAGDEEDLRLVNDVATGTLVGEATACGVRSFVYVSTAAVHGRGPFRPTDADVPPVRPASAASRSRAAAEQHVLAAGGTVLRPHLVYGAEDRWVVPGLVGLVRFLGAPVVCRSVHSAVEVTALARVALAAALRGADRPGVHYVGHPVPLESTELMELVQELGTPAGPPLTPDQARERAAGAPAARHHLDMLLADHWFPGDRIWGLLDCDPGPRPADRLRRLMPAYRKLLDATG